MTIEQKLRIKSLELAILSYGSKGVSFQKPDGDLPIIPLELRNIAETIEEYVLEYGADKIIDELHKSE
jgi:hypothetical protein